MAKYNSNIEIAQEISNRIGTEPVPFESIYSIALEIYNELGGEPTQFDNVYSILLNTLPLVEGGIASKVIDDNVITTVKTWSSSKINSELSGKQNTLTAGDNIDIADNTISAKGYVFDETIGSFAIKYKQDDGDGGQIVSNSASGHGAHAEGFNTQAAGHYGSHAEGTETVASGSASHAEGNNTVASGSASHAEGENTVASNKDAHAEGWHTNASGRAAHTEGFKTQATGNFSHAEGRETNATNNYAHAEGNNTVASGSASHAEGWYSNATGRAAHAEGENTVASGSLSHAEGLYTEATGNFAHAEGYGSNQAHNTASGNGSHVEGYLTIAQNLSEHAEGFANVSHKASDGYGDEGNTQHSIGIGTNHNNTKNAVEVMQNGDYYLLGVGGYQGTDTKVQDATIKTLQEVINGKGDAYETATNDDIDFMFVTEIKLIREQANDKNYIDWLVNTNGETMEYNGQTYYKWVSWANDGNNDDGSWTLIEHPNIIVLTNTLDVQLPFNTNSPEFEYWIDIDGESENNYIHGDYTKKTFQ